MENIRKENALHDYYNMIRKSWTYNRMIKKEKETLEHWIYDEQTKKIVKGSYKQRIEKLNLLYSVFLAGLGYNGFNWREKEETPKF